MYIYYICNNIHRKAGVYVFLTCYLVPSMSGFEEMVNG